MATDPSKPDEHKPYMTRFDCPVCDGIGVTKDLGIIGSVYRTCGNCSGYAKLEMTYSGIAPTRVVRR
jgi:transcription elongation factor Elf1